MQNLSYYFENNLMLQDAQSILYLNVKIISANLYMLEFHAAVCHNICFSSLQLSVYIQIAHQTTFMQNSITPWWSGG